jgi:hypothetical protein
MALRPRPARTTFSSRAAQGNTNWLHCLSMGVPGFGNPTTSHTYFLDLGRKLHLAVDECLSIMSL